MTLKTGKIEKHIEVCSLHYQRKRCFGETNLNEIFMWVDTSYSVNHDMKSNTRGVMSTGLGVTNCRLSKKKFNTNISMEV